MGGGGREWKRGSYTGNCNLFKHFLVFFFRGIYISLTLNYHDDMLQSEFPFTGP